MNFYPVYRLCLSNGAFSRIGSLPETCDMRNIRVAPHILKQAASQFRRKPGEIIILGPRCMAVCNDLLQDGAG